MKNILQLERNKKNYNISSPATDLKKLFRFPQRNRTYPISGFMVFACIWASFALSDTALAKFDFFTPKFDSSSESSISRSIEKFSQFVDTDRDMPDGEKLALKTLMTTLLLEVQKQILDKGGPSLSSNEKEKILVNYLKKYNNLTPTQFLEAWLKEEKEKEERKNAFRNEQIRIENEKKNVEKKEWEENLKKGRSAFDTKINIWLQNSTDPERELPAYGEEDHGKVELKVVGGEVHAFRTYKDREKKIQSHDIISGVIDKETKTIKNIRVSGTSGYCAFFPLDNSYNLASGNDIAQALWFLPKFKEWASKFNGLRAGEQPEFFVKQITSERQTVTTVFFFFRKGEGAGILFRDGPAEKLNEGVKRILENEKITLRQYTDRFYEPMVHEEIAEKYGLEGDVGIVGISGTQKIRNDGTGDYEYFKKLSFYYIGIGDLYLAESLFKSFFDSKEVFEPDQKKSNVENESISKRLQLK